MELHRFHLRQIIALMVWFTFGLSVSAQWNRTSGLEGGFAAALLSTPECVLVGLEDGGVYRSTDGGATWRYASIGLTGEDLGGNAFAAMGPYVFVGTRTGISRSDDHGLTWTTKSIGLPPLGLPITSLAARGTKVFFGAYGAGVYRSQDSGATWSRISTGLADTNVTALLAASSSLYAGTDGGGVFRSTDDGASWQSAGAGLAPGDGSRILSAATASGMLIVGTRGGTYRSTDSGDSWTPATSGLTSIAVPALGSSGTDLFAGTYGSGVYRSTNGGVDWLPSSVGWSWGNVRALCTSGGVLLGGNYGSPVVYRSTNNGAQWIPSGTGITSRFVYALAAANGRVFAGSIEGLDFTSDGGSTWATPLSPLNGLAIYSLVVKGEWLFAGTSYNGPLKSSDSGTTWTPAKGDLPTGNAQSILSMSADASYLYAGTAAGVFRSSDNGDSWQSVKGGMTDTIALSLCSANGRLFAGTSTTMYRSTNNGSAWTPITNGLPSYRIISIVCVDSVLLAVYGFGGNPTVYRSTDTGLSWNPVSDGLPTYSTIIQSLFVDGKNVFGGTAAHGVWLSTDKGGNWSNISDGMSGPGLKISALATSGGYLFAATQGGVWIRPLSQVVTTIQGSDSHETVGTFILKQNYPNPFNPRTVISYSVPTGGWNGQLSGVSEVRLVVYDVLGQEVSVVVNERKEPGNYEVSFDAAKLAGGVYFYQLAAGKFVATRKMLLIH